MSRYVVFVLEESAPIGDMTIHGPWHDRALAERHAERTVKRYPFVSAMVVPLSGKTVQQVDRDRTKKEYER